MTNDMMLTASICRFSGCRQLLMYVEFVNDVVRFNVVVKATLSVIGFKLK